MEGGGGNVHSSGCLVCEEETGDTTISEEPLITGFLQREVCVVKALQIRFAI